MPRETPSLSQTLPKGAIEKIGTRHIGPGVDRNCHPLGESPAFDMPPEGVHSIQLWRGHRQKPELEVPRRGHLQTLLCGMGCSTIFAPHNVPASPRRPHHREEVWLRVVIPMVRYQQLDRACPHVEGTVEHALSPIAGQRAAHLLPKTTIATRSGWGFRHDRLIQPPYHRPLAVCQAPFAPPFAGRQVGARRAKA
jgi:hypothetical protein